MLARLALAVYMMSDLWKHALSIAIIYQIDNCLIKIILRMHILQMNLQSQGTSLRQTPYLLELIPLTLLKVLANVNMLTVTARIQAQLTWNILSQILRLDFPFRQWITL